jgi:hypothetical protein
MQGRHRRRGSIVVVLGIAVVLGTLGAAAAMLSGGLGRRDYHQALRENALEVARTAAEEAALKINNGKVTIQLDDAALETLEPVRMPTSFVTGAHLERLGIPEDAAPEVLVRAARIGPGALRRRPPSEQLREIQEEIETKGYTADQYDRLKTFWNEVGAELGAAPTIVERDRLTSDFWNWSKDVGIERWLHRSKSGDWTTPIGSAGGGGGGEEGLPGVAQLFYEPPSEQGPSPRLEERPRFTDKTFLEELGERWDKAMREVGRDAAQRMASCGANPALAVAHLVGDLRTGALISSDTEVDYTTSFMRSQEVGAEKTYLLEIAAQVEFEGAASQMGGKVHYTTYRLFQKAEWEALLENMTGALVESLKEHDVRPSEIARLFPADSSEERRDQPVPGHPSVRYDPLKVLIDPVYAELPSTAGSRMYPYALAQTYGRGLFDRVAEAENAGD